MCGGSKCRSSKIDLKNWKTNQKNAGFTPEEERLFLDCWITGLSIHSVIFIQPGRCLLLVELPIQFKKNNAGWRIDYFLTSKDLEPRLADAKIHTDIMGGDHCPVELDLK